MLRFKIARNTILQSIISLNASFTSPPSRVLQPFCLKLMGVQLNGPVWMSTNIRISSPQRLILGERVGIGPNSQIDCHGTISIGNDFLSAPGLYINSGTHDLTTMKGYGRKISIGDRVWCGMRVTICAGVSIGDDVVIGAGSLVTRDIPSKTLAFGIPAKPIRSIVRNADAFQSWC